MAKAVYSGSLEIPAPTGLTALGSPLFLGFRIAGLTLAQKDAIFKNLLRWALWKDGWL